MKIYSRPKREDWGNIIKRPVQDFAAIRKTVAPILDKVREEGDQALRYFSQKFDGSSPENLLVSEAEFEAAEKAVEAPLREAIALAQENIAKFHAAQKTEPVEIETTAGVVCSRKSVAIERVGLYVPGGTAPLFSTVLMLAVPANLAGCKEIVLCTPPNKDGEIHPAILFAAKLAGVKKVVNAGGAQAVAAMAYGTENVPSVDKIFGPGNQYVTAAKQIVSQTGEAAIDMPAGPSEVLVYADETCVPAFVAADLLSQAEHGHDSQVVLLTNTEEVATGILEETYRQLEELPRKDMAEGALSNSRTVILDKSVAMDFSNAYAPEHLILAVENAEQVADQVINAGSVFIGNYTPESAGDYASGTNHTLPTNGFARTFGGVSLDSFVKKITFQRISESGLKKLGPSVEIMAEAEELFAHKNAVTLRLEYLKGKK
ncbi:histidinol dehydrogenase [Fulvitalea axinellae]|uniref:Histidinol dehydrogenase n=1 Tax=Fulvitalea axinellae TaxID=1182444 RepID=A0AAU9CK61_9BACT|nr:histidinol dehydrogenase [Fulvitalea axinellae]